MLRQRKIGFIFLRAAKIHVIVAKKIGCIFLRTAKIHPPTRRMGSWQKKLPPPCHKCSNLVPALGRPPGVTLEPGHFYSAIQSRNQGNTSRTCAASWFRCRFRCGLKLETELVSALLRRLPTRWGCRSAHAQGLEIKCLR